MPQDTHTIAYHRSMLLSEMQFIKACVLYIEPTRCNLQENKLSNLMNNICFSILLVFKSFHMHTDIFSRLFLEALIIEVLCQMSLQYWEINTGYQWGLSSKDQPLQYTSSFNFSIVREALKDAEAYWGTKKTLLTRWSITTFSLAGDTISCNIEHLYLWAPLILMYAKLRLIFLEQDPAIQIWVIAVAKDTCQHAWRNKTFNN